MTLRIDRNLVDQETAEALDDACVRASTRRTNNAATGSCINETKKLTHGKATDGVRCRRCALVHRHGRAAAERMLAERTLASPTDYVPLHKVISFTF